MTDRIAEAARATRMYDMIWSEREDGYFVVEIDNRNSPPYGPFDSEEKAQYACDRLNLLAVLEYLREPSEGMIEAAPASDLKTRFGALYVWRAMIDKLLAEARNS